MRKGSIEECEGCPADGCSISNHLKEHNLPMETCPCISCLVKVMCETPCDLFLIMLDYYGREG